MISYWKRALENMMANPFLTLTTLFTITLSVLIAASFFLLFENAGRVTGDWTRGVRVMAYLETGFSREGLPALETALGDIPGVKTITFVSREASLESLQEDLDMGEALLSNLRQNPLPDTLEIQLAPTVETAARVKSFVAAAEQLAGIREVVYGQRWVEGFLPMLNMLKSLAVAVGVLFVSTALFVSANTVRLAFVARQDEIEIMRLVGATEAFVKIPFYLESLFQGLLGGGAGLGLLFFLFRWMAARIPPEVSLIRMADIQFFSWDMIVWIMGGTILLGWVGCFIALKPR